MSAYTDEAAVLVDDIRKYLDKNADVSVLLQGRKSSVRDVVGAKMAGAFVEIYTRTMEGAPEVSWKVRADQVVGLIVY